MDVCFIFLCIDCIKGVMLRVCGRSVALWRTYYDTTVRVYLMVGLLALCIRRMHPRCDVDMIIILPCGHRRDSHTVYPE